MPNSKILDLPDGAPAQSTDTLAVARSAVLTRRLTLANLATLFGGALLPAAHKTTHENGGSDEISVAGLSGLLADAQSVTIRKNSGADVGTRARINLIEGSNVTLTVADDGANGEVDVTIAASGGSDPNLIEIGLAADAPKTDSTLTNLTGFAIPIAANSTEVWQIEIQLVLVNGSAGATADWKFGWTFPAGVTGFWGAHDQTGSATGVLWDHVVASGLMIVMPIQTSVIPVGGTNSITGGVFFRGIFYAGGTSGTLQFQWAQNTTNATAQIVKRGSMGRFKRLIA